jgi:DNA repair exonuclease SbcCD ATPase subunit
MQNNFMLFSDLQKQLSPSPIKTWRLLKQLRDDGRMKEIDDFRMQDRKLYVNVPRFIVELEELGYANLKSNDITGSGMKSDEIKNLADELRLISNEITETRIQEEMKSDDFSADTFKPNIAQQDPPLKSPPANLKSDDFREISSEIIEAKNEVIDVLKDTVSSREQDITQLREVISELSKQNKTLTQQNGWLTNLLVAPKAETEPVRATKVTDISDDITHDDIHHETQTHQDIAREHTTESDGEAVSSGPDHDDSTGGDDEFRDTHQ